MLKTKNQNFWRLPIGTLNLSQRVEEILFGYGISTVGDLTGLTEKELAKLKCLGRLHLEEVKNKLAHFGLTLSTKRAPIKRGKFQRVKTTTEIEIAAEDILGKEKFTLFKKVRFREDESWLAARNQLVEMNLPLVKALVFNSRYKSLKFPQLKRIVDPVISKEDVFQEGVNGLIYAVENFDYARGKRFSTYAVRCIVRFIKDSFRQLSPMPTNAEGWISKLNKATMKLWGELERRPSAEEIANKTGFSIDRVKELLVYLRSRDHTLSLDAPLHNKEDEEDEEDEKLVLKEIITYPEELSSLEKVIKEDLKRIVNQIINEAPLSEVKKFCLRLYYGLDGEFPHSLKETGDILGVTESRACQLIKEWTHYLRDPRIKNRL